MSVLDLGDLLESYSHFERRDLLTILTASVSLLAIMEQTEPRIILEACTESFGDDWPTIRGEIVMRQLEGQMEGAE